MIPDAAVEAAAKALYGAAPWPPEWHDADGARKETYLHYAKIALEAGLPHIRSVPDTFESTFRKYYRSKK